MYDTLMQMGRWFGYRPGYVDLCRLFTSEELNEWFMHITLASEELRSEFDYLAGINGTPEDYSLKVRNSPGQLQVTSISKMRYTKQIEVSWAGRLIETYQLPMDKGTKKKNLIATDDFISTLGTPEQKGNNFLWRNISPDDICDYLSKFKVADSLKKVDLLRISEYIQDLAREGELTSWRVGLMNKKDGAETQHTFSNGLVVGCFDRNRADNTPYDTYCIKKNHIVGNQKDEFLDLDNDLLENALIETKRIKATQNRVWDKDYPAPEVVRQKFRSINNPLLLIYPLNPECANVKGRPAGSIVYEKTDEPFIGFVISFPGSGKQYAISYTVNQIAEFAETEDLFDNENDNTYDEQ